MLFSGHSASLTEDGRSLEPQLSSLTSNVNAMYGSSNLSPVGGHRAPNHQPNGHNMLLVAPPIGTKGSPLNPGGSATNPRKYACKMCPQVSEVRAISGRKFSNYVELAQKDRARKNRACHRKARTASKKGQKSIESITGFRTSTERVRSSA